LAEEQFGLYAVCARFPQGLSGQVPWQEEQTGVYYCRWGTDMVRIVVAGQLPREPHNAPLHLFSAAPDLVGFGRNAYQRRSEDTSMLLKQLLEKNQEEGLPMAYTMEDFKRDYVKEHLAKLSPEEQQHVLDSLPLDRRLAGLSAEQIRKYLNQLSHGKPAASRKSRRKK